MKNADANPAYWREYGPFQQVKHDLIRNYLGGWFPKLGTWAGRVLYVDTHAGRGRHRSGETGSPLVALYTLLNHPYRDQLLEKSEVRFLFIERDPANLRRLDEELDRIGDLPDRVHVDRSANDAYEVLPEIVHDLEATGRSMAPAFIFVDPYGFKVPGDLLGRLMAAGRVELFVNVIWRELDMAIRQQQPREHGLAKTLDAIFAGESWRRIDGVSVDERMQQVVELISKMVGAKWYTCIRMTSGGSAVRYLLLHLTNHDKGRDLMKECVWKVVPDGGFEVMQRHDPKQPLLITPTPDLEPLEEWLVERLTQRPHTRNELKAAIRSELWLPTHLTQLIRRLRANREIEIDGSGSISLQSAPRLPLS